MMKGSQPILRRTSKPIAKRAAPMKIALFLMLPATLPATFLAQALPAASASPVSTGFSLPSASGTLQYAVSASQSMANLYIEWKPSAVIAGVRLMGPT